MLHLYTFLCIIIHNETKEKYYLGGIQMFLKKGCSKLAAGVLLITLTIGAAGCGASGSSGKSATESAVDRIKKAGKIVVGTSADYPPYEFHKQVNGKDTIVGFDIDIANEIAKDLGVKLEIKDMKFDGLLPALDTGNVDMVIAGMTPTPERQKNVDFSKIYYTAVQTVVVRANDKAALNSIDALKGKKVGVQKGSVQEGIAKDQMPNSEAKALSKISDEVLELKNNKVDALIVEKPVANAYAQKNADIIISDMKLKQDESGSAVAVKKGSSALTEAINKTLDRLLMDKSIDKMVTDETNAIQ
jgi:arginine/lysine/histidine transporter system substrate-binding protein